MTAPEQQPTHAAGHPAWKVWSNPILHRYRRSRLRARNLTLGCCITFLISAFIVGITSSFGIRTEADPVSSARSAIIPLLVLQAFILFVMGTAQVSGGMITERDEGGVDYQRLVPMSPLAKVLGYLLGLPIREYVLAAVTLPFTVWVLARGQVPFTAWAPLYWVLLTTTLAYHSTGLLAGTVVRNRRWAFLISIGMVFSLYTIIPQLARFGLVFFKYLTITPVLDECLPDLLPENAGAALKVGRHFFPTAKFFDLGLPEALFTTFSQAGLVFLFLGMLCRKWRRDEAHLLSKSWAVGALAWVQVLLLGNALPLIASGDLFPSRNFRLLMIPGRDWAPTQGEALTMIALYGCFTAALVCVLAGIVTPSLEQQVRGWRRARNQGLDRLPPGSDSASGRLATLLMALGGAVGWFIFTRQLLESRWFPGHHAGWEVLTVYTLILMAVCGSFQALLDTRGGRAVAIATLFIGVLPVLVGAIVASIGDRYLHPGVWIAGLSPVSLPLSAPVALLSITDSEVLPVLSIRGVARFGWVAWTLVCADLLRRQFRHRSGLRTRIPGGEGLTVREIGTSDRELDRFWRVMVGISGAQAACVLPLRVEVVGVLGSENPFWSQARRRLWIAERGGRAVGRIAGIVSDEHQRIHGAGTAFFGHLECEDDPEAARALFETVSGWARAQGCQRLLGPMNPNINEECGLLISGFDRANSVMMPHNPPHLPRRVEAEGFVKAKDLLVFDIDLAKSPTGRLERFREAAGRRAPEVRLTAVTRRNLDRLLPALKSIYNEAWERNWSAVPMSGPEIDFLARRLKPLLVEGLVWLAESSGRPAGLLLAIPDVNEALGPLKGELLRPPLLRALPMLLGWRRPERFRLVALGVTAEHRRRGIEGMMFAETLAAARRLGFRRCEASWILEDNRAVQQMVAIFEGSEVQRYRIYERPI